MMRSKLSGRGKWDNEIKEEEGETDRQSDKRQTDKRQTERQKNKERQT